MKLALTATAAFTPLERVEQPVLVVDDGRIAAFGPRTHVELPAGARHVDLGDAIMAPGFIDIHIHGGGGHDVMEGEPAALAAVETLLAKHGVTSYYPTTVTAQPDVTLKSLEKLGRAIGAAKGDGTRARPLGLHFEGPFISHAKRGVHPSAHIVRPALQLFEKMWQACGGTAGVMTIAPELPGAPELIRIAAERGVCVSMGHSDSDTARTLAGIEAGARHATHTFNAMRALDHREPGILGLVLSDDRLTADIIADGIHVDPAMMRLFLRAKGEERAVLITDAISATGRPDGRYRLGAFEVDVKGDRCLSAEGRLAGSVLTMDRAVRNVVEMCGWKLQQAVRLATLNPARVVGIDGRKGSLAAGMDADVNVLSARGEVLHTLIAGKGI